MKLPGPLKAETELCDFVSVSGQRALVIFNPVAGNRGRLLLDAVLEQLQALGWRTTLIETKHAGHAEQIASTLNEETPGASKKIITTNKTDRLTTKNDLVLTF